MERTRRGRPLGEGRIDEAKVDATAEESAGRYLTEEGFDPDNPLGVLRPVLPIAAVRAKTGLTQERLAEALHVPVSMLRDWEQGRLSPDPVAMALFAIVNDDPERAFEVLAR